MTRIKDRPYVQVLKCAPAHLRTKHFQAKLKESLEEMLGDAPVMHILDSELYAQVHYATDTVLFEVLFKYFDGNQSKVADVLGISRFTVRSKALKMGFDIGYYK